MAKLYSLPKGMTAPTFEAGIAAYDAACEKLTKDVQEWCRKNGTGELRGELYNYPVADGHAQYVIYSCSPLKLIHLPVGDAWHMPAIAARGLRLADIQQQFKASKRLQALFAKQKEGA